MNNAAKEFSQAFIALSVALAVGWAGSRHGHTLSGIPVMLACVGTAFLIQWLVFLHAWRFRTERYFDLTGSLTYLCVLLLALNFGNSEPRSLLIGALVSLWALRLGTFLFMRVSKDGHDRRFDVIKTRFSTFFMTWTLQGLWVSLTLAAGLAAMTATDSVPLGPLAFIGALVWLFGFLVEAIADGQKNRFRADPGNAGRFITGGLWAWSRHPNYFGEITLWLGIALIALPVLKGWQYVTLISPLFVYVLLTRISGVGMLERRADRAWGSDPEYQAYKARTPVLMPKPPA
jgi:steroid 5-alpha reductase family enzyme